MTFQSTHSLRSATRFFDEQSAVGWRFNPRTPCGVRHFPVILIPQLARFQSTHSLRSATNRQLACLLPTGVSIHALLAECDLGMTRRRATMTCFNPRTPCGVRLVRRAIRSHKSRFQSTHSLRSATEEACLVELGLKVSIHALLAECDVQGGESTFFLSVSIHALLAECDASRRNSSSNVRVSIHALLAECDQLVMRDSFRWTSFNPRTPCGVRRCGI